MEQLMQEELVEGIKNILEDNLISIVLYGSVARGTATEESDIDIAIIAKHEFDIELRDKVVELAVDIDLKYDTVLSIVDIDYKKYLEWQDIMPFYKNIKKEGIVLWNAA